MKLIQINFPKISSGLIEKIKNSIKKGQDLVAGDLGNFTQVHVDVLEQATNYQIPIINFSWSSGNHHLARLIGAFKLLLEIENKQKKGDKILLIGHSHAGQLFSLITLMFSDRNIANYFVELVKDEISSDELKWSPDFLNKLKSLTFDFVTLGTPPKCNNQHEHRYGNQKKISRKSGGIGRGPAPDNPFQQPI